MISLKYRSTVTPPRLTDRTPCGRNSIFFRCRLAAPGFRELRRLVHEGGFRIEKDYRDRWFFKRPDGRAVPACGYRAEDMCDDDVDATREYFHGHTSAEGFLASVQNRRPGASPAVATDRRSP